MLKDTMVKQRHVECVGLYVKFENRMANATRRPAGPVISVIRTRQTSCCLFHHARRTTYRVVNGSDDKGTAYRIKYHR